MPADLVREQQQEIAKQMQDARRQLERANGTYGELRGVIEEALARAASCHRAYVEASDVTRRQWNQTFFEHFVVKGRQVVGSKGKGANALLLEPELDQRLERDIRDIREADEPRALYERQGSNKLVLVQARGLEPPTGFPTRSYPKFDEGLSS
jgi:hypothetical protein